MPDEDGFPTDAETVQIYNLVDAGTAFQNPVAQSIADLKVLIADQMGKLVVLEAIANPNGIINWSQIDFTNLIAALGDVDVALDDFLTHTNRTSGTSFPGDILSTQPSFLSLTAVSVSLLEIEGKINQGESDSITNFFGSLTDFPPIIAGWIEFLTDLDLKIQIIAPYQPPEFPDQPLPVATIAEVTGWTLQMDTTRTQESASFDSGIATIIKWSMASSLITPSGVWRDFVHDVVATPELQALLPEVE